MRFERMAKLRLYGFIPVLLLVALGSAHAQYALHVKFSSSDSLIRSTSLGIPPSFKDRTDCTEYIYKLTDILRKKGFTAASVDSIQFDSTAAFLQLYIGERFTWSHINTRPEDVSLLENAGWNTKKWLGKPAEPGVLHLEEIQLLNYLENNGYPFARISLDSVSIFQGAIQGLLKLEKGPLYKIDSIRVIGSAKISIEFMERYLGIPEGSIYKKDRLLMISRRIRELPFVQEERTWTLNMLGTGSILNLYLKPRKSSQIDALVGFMPNSNQQQGAKLLVTGEATIVLRNPFGNGEYLALNWQQLQVQSPRLNLGYQQPYIFNSSFGVDVLFNLFKKDSTYLQINALMGLQYILSANQSGKVFLQWQKSFLLGNAVDTNLVIATKRLPPDIDVNAINVGLDYNWNKTDYRLNPRTGNEFRITASAGIKTIGRNNEIISIKDPSFNYGSLYDSLKEKSYQFRIRVAAAHYFPLGKQAALKTALNLGIFQSPGTFRNELFQIGGYRLLRGFDEESIYATQFGVLTTEYRYRLALNSFLFGFVDAAWVKNKYQSVNLSNTFIGTGGGLAFETRFGLLNISYALGKRDDVKFNFRESQKIHFGYVNYF